MLIYNQGWLFKFLDPKNQPEEIKCYLQEENKLLLQKIKNKSKLVDFGCGFGRHLELLRKRLSYGLGLDTNKAHIEFGRRRLKKYSNLELRIIDVRYVTMKGIFDYAICMNNTLGNIKEKEKVIGNMKKVIATSGNVFIGVYSPSSIESRIKWYEKTGLKIIEVKEDYILTDKGFKTEHFTLKKLKKLFGDPKIKDITGIGYFITL